MILLNTCNNNNNNNQAKYVNHLAVSVSYTYMLWWISRGPKSSSTWNVVFQGYFKYSHLVSEVFCLWRCCNHHLLTSKIPVGSHVKGHVGDHHQILAQSKEGINSRFTISVVAFEEVESQQTETTVEEEEAALIPVWPHLLMSQRIRVDGVKKWREKLKENTKCHQVSSATRCGASRWYEVL